MAAGGGNESAATDPFERFCQTLDGRIERRGEREALARCPAHRDLRASLSVAKGNNGKVLLNCFAGCSAESIVAALGLELADLFPQRTRRRRGGSKAARIVDTYPYVDEQGAVLYEVVRYEPKSFRQRRPDGRGGWTWSTRGVQRVPYRLDRLVKAPAGKPIIVVEGERDVHSLEALDLLGTTSAGGARSWRKTFGDGGDQELLNRVFRARDAAVVGDNDRPGRSYADSVARALQEIAGSVRMVELEGLQAHGDVSDWIGERRRAGRSSEEIRGELGEQIRAAPVFDPAAPPAGGGTDAAGEGELDPATEYSDLRASSRLVARLRGGARYVHKWGSWILWNGARWKEDESEEILRHARDVAGEIENEAGRRDLEEAAQSGRKRPGRRWRNAARRLLSERTLSAVERLARSAETVPVRPDELDRDAWLLGTQSGVVDLRTAELLEPDPARLITRSVATTWSPGAACPRWEKFLEEVTLGDEELARYLQRAIGYTISGSVRERALFVLVGPGGNGKSVLLDSLRHLLGEYARRIDASSIVSHYGGRPIPCDLAGLQGRRMACASETTPGQRLDTGRIKDIVGGEKIAARFMRENWIEFFPQFKLWLGTNHPPGADVGDQALWDRIRTVRFRARFERETQDRDLSIKLRTEFPGILQWCVRGCQEWQARGLAEPESVQVATGDYRRDADDLGEFLDERCETGPTLRVPASQLYQAYVAWCREADGRVASRKAFSASLRARGLRQLKNSSRYWDGIALARVGSGGPRAERAQFSLYPPPHREITIRGSMKTGKADACEDRKNIPPVLPVRQKPGPTERGAAGC